jgi:hypothetical protein
MIQHAIDVLDTLGVSPDTVYQLRDKQPAAMTRPSLRKAEPTPARALNDVEMHHHGHVLANGNAGSINGWKDSSRFEPDVGGLGQNSADASEDTPHTTIGASKVAHSDAPLVNTNEMLQGPAFGSFALDDTPFDFTTTFLDQPMFPYFTPDDHSIFDSLYPPNALAPDTSLTYDTFIATVPSLSPQSCQESTSLSSSSRKSPVVDQQESSQRSRIIRSPLGKSYNRKIPKHEAKQSVHDGKARRRAFIGPLERLETARTRKIRSCVRCSVGKTRVSFYVLLSQYIKLTVFSASLTTRICLKSAKAAKQQRKPKSLPANYIIFRVFDSESPM